MTLEMVTWCSLCNAKPAEGDLAIENPVDPSLPPETIRACFECVSKLPWGD